MAPTHRAGLAFKPKGPDKDSLSPSETSRPLLWGRLPGSGTRPAGHRSDLVEGELTVGVFEVEVRRGPRGLPARSRGPHGPLQFQAWSFSHPLSERQGEARGRTLQALRGCPTAQPLGTEQNSQKQEVATTGIGKLGSQSSWHSPWVLETGNGTRTGN